MYYLLCQLWFVLHSYILVPLFCVICLPEQKEMLLYLKCVNKYPDLVAQRVLPQTSCSFTSHDLCYDTKRSFAQHWRSRDWQMFSLQCCRSSTWSSMWPRQFAGDGDCLLALPLFHLSFCSWVRACLIAPRHHIQLFAMALSKNCILLQVRLATIPILYAANWESSYSYLRRWNLLARLPKQSSGKRISWAGQDRSLRIVKSWLL